jgi:hypothetical protein
MAFAYLPALSRKPEEVTELIFSPLCSNNLATYLTLTEKLPVPRGQEPDSRKVALMVKGCDSRAVVQQISGAGMFVIQGKTSWLSAAPAAVTPTRLLPIFLYVKK